jgi:hypothetical protein
MLPIETYEQRANECLQFAESSSSFNDRTTWRELALCWLRLSEHAERFRAARGAGLRGAWGDNYGEKGVA